MQIETFKMFCDLVETESFTKAAQISGVTQSAVSQQISALERIFNSVLIERSKKVFKLTREGQAVYDYSKEIVRASDSLHDRLEELKNIISGSIRVSTIYSIGLYELPAFVKKFMQSYPTVNVHVEYRHDHQVYDDVLSNTVEFGLVAYPVKDPKLEIVALRKEPLVLACHPQHPFAKLDKVRLHDLNGQKFVGFGPDIPTRRALDRILKSHGVRMRYEMEFDNVDTVKRAVEIDAGVAIVPAATIVAEVARRTLVAVPIADGDFFRPTAAIYKKKKTLTPAMKQLLAVLKGPV
jgi:LysR family transcriptional regulator, transcriptional activator of the cysJI operon